jgi:cytochrome c oxidase subunit 2
VLTVGTVAILFGLVIVSVSTGKSISQLGDRKGIMTIEVTGNQWWWQFRYMNSDPSLIFTTANELHIPVGQPVTIRGTSNDVIHSFWVPNLHGKTDLIPSRVTQQTLEADFAGRFRGQCAEFCGMQHAQMAIWVIAEPRDQFNQWMKNQLQSAAPPSTPSQFRGQQVFLGNGCVLCHAIQGTSAGGQNAPDLTHLASRGTIAAGTLRNTRESLRHWITDPQQPKPGNHMATIRLDDKDVPPLLDYLESLKCLRCSTPKFAS